MLLVFNNQNMNTTFPFTAWEQFYSANVVSLYSNIRVSEHNYIIHRICVPLGLAMAKASSVVDYEKLQQLGQGSFGTVFKA